LIQEDSPLLLVKIDESSPVGFVGPTGIKAQQVKEGYLFNSETNRATEVEELSANKL
jgi:hypothetical protein